MSALATAGLAAIGVGVVYAIVCGVFAFDAWRQGEKADSTLFASCALLTLVILFIGLIGATTP